MKNKLLNFFVIFLSFVAFGIYAKSTRIRIDNYCYRENNTIYLSGSEDKTKIELIKDPNTFERVGVYSGEYEDSLYYKDSKNAYCNINNPYSYELEYLNILTGADPQTLKQKYKYEKIYLDKNNLYFNCEKVQGGDPNTFSKNKYGEYFDKNNVYQEYREYEGAFISNITGADSATFKRINHKISELGDIYKDKDHIFLPEHPGGSLINIVTGSDSKTFKAKVFKYGGKTYYFFKDKNNLYFNYETYFVSLTNPIYTINVIPGINPATFKIFTPHIIIDNNKVFSIGENDSNILTGSDANSFKLYFKTKDFQIYKDKNQLYYGKIENKENYDNIPYSVEDKIYAVPMIDAQTFVYLDGKYAKDKNYIYYLGNEIYKIEGADRNSFNVKGDGKAEDKNYIYDGVNKTKK